MYLIASNIGDGETKYWLRKTLEDAIGVALTLFVDDHDLRAEEHDPPKPSAWSSGSGLYPAISLLRDDPLSAWRFLYDYYVKEYVESTDLFLRIVKIEMNRTKGVA